jgi:four helix bundle protein
MDTDIRFNFQQLDVYRRAIEFLSLSTLMLDEMPRGYSTIADQFRRASISVPLNIAEAQGRPGTGEAKRAYAIARGSAMECAAILDVCAVLNAADKAKIQEAQGLLLRVVQMLTKLIR